MVVVASLIGVIAGLANICFRTVLEFVHHSIFVPGYAIVSQGDWRIILLPLIPISGMVLLIPLAIFFPGEIYGYGFTKFLRKVNIRGGSPVSVRSATSGIMTGRAGLRVSLTTSGLMTVAGSGGLELIW